MCYGETGAVWLTNAEDLATCQEAAPATGQKEMCYAMATGIYATMIFTREMTGLLRLMATSIFAQPAMIGILLIIFAAIRLPETISDAVPL